jgi:uncharacterized membrane protein YeaQ/YmgE (transglycosylase-associated protein family)
MVMLQLVVWVVFGWIAGSIAEWLWPPAQPHAKWQTIAIGVIGSVAGGLAGSLVSGDHYRPAGIVLSVLGAVACMFVWRKLDEVKP